MPILEVQLKRFRRCLIMRQVLVAALWGALFAAGIVATAPWLRSWMPLPQFIVETVLPILLPATVIGVTLRRKPDARSAAMVADSWLNANGTVISAYELEKTDADSPFLPPVRKIAERRLQNARVPLTALTIRLIVGFVLMLACVGASNFLYSNAEADKKIATEEERKSKVSVSPEEAKKLADEAGRAAETAEELEAKAQHKLAEDLEQAAKNAQAGGGDKETALDQANNLKDRADNQVQAHEARKDARDALLTDSTTNKMAEAINELDKDKLESDLDNMSKKIFGPDGDINEKEAAKLKSAINKARQEAPKDMKLQRQAQTIEQTLDDSSIKRAQKKRNDINEKREAKELDPEVAKAALDALQNADREFLKQALEEFAESASELRDVNQGESDVKKLAHQLKNGQISPEDAKELAEKARNLSKRLQSDADALKKMLQEGDDFEGLKELAKEMAAGKQAEGSPSNSGEKPDWAKLPGSGGADKVEGNRTEMKTGDGKEGIDTKDTGKGDLDPDSKEEKLDVEKATGEKADRDITGKESNSDSLNTREDRDRLPRRYKSAARKYFER